MACDSELDAMEWSELNKNKRIESGVHSKSQKLSDCQVKGLLFIINSIVSPIKLLWEAEDGRTI